MIDALIPSRAPPASTTPPTRWLGRVIDSDIFYSFRRSRLTMVAAAVTVVFFLLAIFAPLLAVQNPFDLALGRLVDVAIPSRGAEKPRLHARDLQG